jgi:nitrate reductase NapAB chaperone NapD
MPDARTHISSLLVHAREEDVPQVRRAIEALGAEVPAVERGRMVVVIEAADGHGLVAQFDRIARIDGVHSTGLVSHFVDDDTLEREPDEAHAS